MKDLFYNNDFDRKYRIEYQNGHTQPTNPANHFDAQPTENAKSVGGSNAVQQAELPTIPSSESQLSPKDAEARLQVFGYSIVEIIQAMFPNGVPQGSRHKQALKLASDLMITLDGNESLVKTVLLKLTWVQDVIRERGEKEIDDIVDSAKKRLKKRESETFSELRPSRDMQKAIEQVTYKKYNQLVADSRQLQVKACGVSSRCDIGEVLDKMGRRLTYFSKHYILLPLLFFGLKLMHYAPALFVGSAFCMNLMTRMWYRFWPAPGKKCRLNHLLELIGRQGSGKRFAVLFYLILMEPVKKSDAAQIAALNRWKEERAQNNGAAKNRTPEPKGIYRCLPSEASAAAVRDAEANAREIIDGEEWYLHISQFDSELQNTLSQMKKSYFSALYTLWLKGFHNEPHGALLKSATSIVGEWPVHYNVVYTGTQHALDQQVNVGNYATGLNGRITAVPMGDSNFEMMENQEYTEEDARREEKLREWAYRLDNTKGEIPCKDISDALYKWTARRMDDARENQSLADEDLLKRPCWHAINYALPLIVSRHWDQMVQDSDGRWVCGPDFKTDKIDRELALFICDAQYTFQQYFFGDIAEQHYDNTRAAAASNVQHQKRTMLAYDRLPNPFTSDDVDRAYGYEGVRGSINSRLKRLQDDGLAQRIRTGKDKGKYRKLA